MLPCLFVNVYVFVSAETRCQTSCVVGILCAVSSEIRAHVYVCNGGHPIGLRKHAYVQVPNLVMCSKAFRVYMIEACLLVMLV